MNFKKYIAEFKRRNVFGAVITYLLVAWVIAQVFAIVLPAFNVPKYFLKTLIIILIIGFPVSLIFAWVYELSPKGIKKFRNVDAEKLKTEQPKHQLNNDNKKLVVLPFQNTSANVFVYSLCDVKIGDFSAEAILLLNVCRFVLVQI